MKWLIGIALLTLILVNGCVNTGTGKPVTISNFILAEYKESSVNIEEKNNISAAIMAIKVNLKNLGEEQDCINKFLLEDAQGKIYEQQKIIFKNSENNNQICLEANETAELTVFFEISSESEFYKLTHQNKNLTNELIETIKLSQNRTFLCDPIECEKESKTFCEGTIKTEINAYCNSENRCILETAVEENSEDCGYVAKQEFPYTYYGDTTSKASIKLPCPTLGIPDSVVPTITEEAIFISSEQMSKIDFDGWELTNGNTKQVGCFRGFQQGQNVNYIYCKSGWIKKTPISDDGVVGERARYMTAWIFIPSEDKYILKTMVYGSVFSANCATDYS